jgi:hypothetical protein
MTTIIRYAPHYKVAHKYVAVGLKDFGRPFRDETLEFMVYNNIIKILWHRGNEPLGLDIAIALVKSGVLNCDYDPPTSQNQVQDFSKPGEIFRKTPVEVLEKFNRKPDDDDTKVIPK